MVTLAGAGSVRPLYLPVQTFHPRGFYKSLAHRKPATPEAVQFKPYSSRKKRTEVAHLCCLVGELVCLSGKAGEVYAPPVPQPSFFLR